MSNYSRFFVLISKLQGNQQELKEDLILQFTNNRTCSLKEMHNKEYNTMLNHLEALTSTNRSKWSENNMDKCRKRVIASICGYYNLIGQKYDIKYVLATACRTAQTKPFNNISATELHRIYNVFTAKQRDCKKAIKTNTTSINEVSLN